MTGSRGIGGIWLKHSSWAERESPYTLCTFTSALEKCDKICSSHSYREADGQICDLFELFREAATLKCYGESQTVSKKDK